jgi:ABC-type transporter Mla MlaB component
MAASSPRTVTLTIRNPLRRSDLPGLFQRTCALLDGSDIGIEVLRCELAGVAADGIAVDALARLALAARRRGCRVRLFEASEELHALVALVGLAGVLGGDATPAAAGEGRTAGRSSPCRGKR